MPREGSLGSEYKVWQTRFRGPGSIGLGREMECARKRMTRRPPEAGSQRANYAENFVILKAEYKRVWGYEVKSQGVTERWDDVRDIYGIG
jgi:hypothetical protein